MTTALVLAALAVTPSSGQARAGSRPHIVFVLQDDLGFYDVAFNGNTNATDVSFNISTLASEGIVLKRHYTHWHCSPTRRSFVSGRLPIHHHEQLGGTASDDLDLRYTWFPKKLAAVGYRNYAFGKLDTGCKSMNHLPTRNGFHEFVGFLPGAQLYSGPERWENEHPVYNDTFFANMPAGCEVAAVAGRDRASHGFCAKMYSTDLYGRLALQAIENHPQATPLFLYLPFQAVHVPYTAPPSWAGDNSTLYRSMLWDADVYVGAIVNALKKKKLYGSTLMVYSSDNGGVADGNNYPLRGCKATNWEGGLRVAAFVSGGAIPVAMRGTSNAINFHIVDWYPTFCFLAGVDGTDDPPVPPEPVDPARPSRNIWGKQSYPPVDGVNIWPMLMAPAGRSPDAAHKYLVLSKEVVVAGHYKLLVAQNDHGNPYSQNGWKDTAGVWHGQEMKLGCEMIDLPGGLNGSSPGIPGHPPCVFDLSVDSSERHDLVSASVDNPSQHNATEQLLQELWSVLNHTVLTAFCKNMNKWPLSPKNESADHVAGAGCQSSPSVLLGHCNETCAYEYWTSAYGAPSKGITGPICGVPGCNAPDTDRF